MLTGRPAALVAWLIGAGVLLLGGMVFWSLLSPGLAPRPYPGADITRERNVNMGNCCYADRVKYAIDESFTTVERHYARQMAKYCLDHWSFEDFSQTNDYGHARIAGCRIQQWPVEKDFLVILYFDVSDTTFVSQQVIIESP